MPSNVMNHSKAKVLLSWSSGKDSAYTLEKLVSDSKYEVVGLMTTVTKEYERVSMHATRINLLKEQAKKLKLPLHQVTIPKDCSNKIYESTLLSSLAQFKGVDCIAFGDIHLSDVKNYREKLFAKTEIVPIFPIWEENPRTLSKKIIASGIKAITTCIDLHKISKKFCGKVYSETFVNKLPEDVDVCGENGEFHTFVYDAPLFGSQISIGVAEIVQKNIFYLQILSNAEF